MRGKFPCPTHSFVRQTQKTVGTTKTKYVYSGSQLLEEYNGTTNALLRRYVYAGPNEPIFQIASNGTVTYLHHDHLGSVIAQANASGVVGNKYKYSPFGEATSMTGTTIGYTGQRWDNETGLYHYKARYYRPGINRFLQTDPIGYTEDLHLYAYVRNDPMNLTDPDGLEEDDPTFFSREDLNMRYVKRQMGMLRGPFAENSGHPEYESIHPGMLSQAGMSGRDFGGSFVYGSGPIGAMGVSPAKGPASLRQASERPYPQVPGAPMPQAPLRRVTGAEYLKERAAANKVNREIRKMAPNELKGKEIHEIHPVSLGGSGTDPANKVIVPRGTHRSKLTPYWNDKLRELKKQ